MTTVVVAPDSFKGSLSAAQVAAHLTAGLLDANPGLTVVQIPMADGGEGTLDAALGAGFQPCTAIVTGPLGVPVTAQWGLRPADGETACCAVIELAQASGLALSDHSVASALRATSFGTGELIRAALDAGARHLILAIGGSACTDGGAGLVSALGVRLIDSDGRPVDPGGAALTRLAAVDRSALDPRLATTSITVAVDVHSPLLGPAGAAAVFAPQKGADAAAVRDLEAGLTRWVACLAESGVDVESAALAPGAGAAGGVGFAAMTLLGASPRPGVDLVLELTRFHDRVAGASLVITGEGSLDSQSLAGKAPIGIAAAARGIPTVAVVGRTSLSEGDLRAHGIDACYALTSLEPRLAACMTRPGPLLEQLGRDIAATHLP